MNRYDFNTFLNKQPKEFRAKTYPALAELCRLKVPVQKALSISKTLKEVKQHYKDNPEGLFQFEILKDKTFGTANGRGWFSAADAQKMFIETQQWAEEDFALFYITVWHPEPKLWISLKDINYETL